MTEKAVDGVAFKPRVLPRVPVRPWGTGDDFGGIAVYVSSGASGYHTGYTFAIDAGDAIL